MQGARSRLAVCVLLCALIGTTAGAQQTPAVKSGLEPADYTYQLGPGVARREVIYFSDDVACFAVLFFPRNFSASGAGGRTPAVVVAPSWAGTHLSIEKYGARFAEKGLVAMVIDYRGWGYSDGFTTLSGKKKMKKNDDAARFTRIQADVVVKRTRLVPYKQVEDIRNAISYLQGEPGVDPEQIGLWSSSFAGGNSIVVAAMDARVKAIALQAPAIAGKNAPKGPMQLRGRMLEDAIKRARMGQGDEQETGFTTRRNIDVETNQLVAEYRPFRFLKDVGDRPVLFVIAGNEQLLSNKDNAYAAAEVLNGPKKIIEVPGASHFDLYVNEPFEVSANSAADWFRDHLGAKGQIQ